MSTTRIVRHINAPRAAVYRALLDARAVATWRVPRGMTSEVHELDAREGGSIRVSLTYDAHAHAPTGTGKTTVHTDTYHGRFVKLVPDEQVVEMAEFETDDPSLRGEMTISFTLVDAGGGTDVFAEHEGLPPGVPPEDNELGWRMSLDNLAAFVEGDRHEMPASIRSLADTLATMPGAVAVVLGGSRAIGAASPTSDWDLGVYYRGAIDTTALAGFGVVHPPGAWGRIMNGGAWLTIEGRKVDVLLRDLDVVERWSARAREGEFEVDALLGYVAGVPTYSLLAERAVAVLLRGELPSAGDYPRRLAETAPARWRFCSDFSLKYARMHADRGDAVGTVGQAAKAILEEAHARACAERRWVLNEKRLVERAGLAETQSLFREIPAAPERLRAWVDDVGRALTSARATEGEPQAGAPITSA